MDRLHVSASRLSDVAPMGTDARQSRARWQSDMLSEQILLCVSRGAYYSLQVDLWNGSAQPTLKL